MSEYTRSTRECTLDELRPELASAIRAQVEKYQIGKIEAGALMCIETTSTRQKKGLFGGSSEVIHMGVLLTPQWLIWAAGKPNEKPGIISARIGDIDARDFENTAMYKIMPDSGVDVTGRYTDVTQQGMSFIGLGPEPAGQKFRQLLHETIEKAGKK